MGQWTRSEGTTIFHGKRLTQIQHFPLIHWKLTHLWHSFRTPPKQKKQQLVLTPQRRKTTTRTAPPHKKKRKHHTEPLTNSALRPVRPPTPSGPSIESDERTAESRGAGAERIREWQASKPGRLGVGWCSVSHERYESVILFQVSDLATKLRL